MEAPSKTFLLFFLLIDWLKLNHLKSRMECAFSDIFSLHICSTVAETIGVTNYAASFGAKNVQKTTFEAAEIMLGPWNQQYKYLGILDSHDKIIKRTIMEETAIIELCSLFIDILAF